MFGKPEWFREKTVGWGLTPAKWQGWAYAIVWGGVLTLPFLAFLLSLHRVPEALLWLGFGTIMLTWDVRGIIREMRHQAAGDVFVIDDETDASSLATRNFDMHLKD
jgi:hypothetical protein